MNDARSPDRSREDLVDRVSRVFGFLKAVQEERNPPPTQIRQHPWVLRFSDIPQHDCTHIRPISSYLNTEERDVPDAGRRDAILTVRRPQLTDPPTPPAEIRKWLKGTWSDPKLLPEHLSVPPSGMDDDLETFDHDSGRAQAWTAWINEWRQWSDSERPTRVVLDLYQRLFALHGRLERESEAYELMVGDGILQWHAPGGQPVQHPILLQAVDLIFESGRATFRILEGDRPTEFYSSAFARNPNVDGARIRAYSKRAEEHGLHPLAPGETTGFLRDLAASLSAGGEYMDGPVERKATFGPCYRPRSGSVPAASRRRTSARHRKDPD